MDKFEEVFPGATSEEDASVISQLRKEALVLIKQAFSGEKLTYAQQDLAKFVSQSLMQPQSGGVHIHITWKEIERARERAGLAPKVIDMIAETSEKSD